MKIVIRAGGVGSRLWPISRVNNPKQFQKIVGDRTMIRTTYERIEPLLKSPADIFMSVNENFKDKARRQIPEILKKNIIVETDTRNTGPAICLEVCYLERFCADNEVIASITSDDYISDDRSFRSLLLTTEEFVLKNPDYILTPAIRPDYPDTGYTYFKAGKNLQKNGAEVIYAVANVVEKPNPEYCRELVETGVYFCHTGMYLWQLKHVRSLFIKHQPAMYEVCRGIVDIMLAKKPNWSKARKLYGQLEKITIESAITDKAEKLAMSVSNRIGWSDLGKWHVVKRILSKEKNENLIQGDVYAYESENNLVYCANGKKIVIINDIEGLAIVDTDDALYVSSLKNSADNKNIIEDLKQKGKQKYL